MDELTELARELGAEIVIFATNEIARYFIKILFMINSIFNFVISFGEKDL